MGQGNTKDNECDNIDEVCVEMMILQGLSGMKCTMLHGC
jgi:hypothetical protein